MTLTVIFYCLLLGLNIWIFLIRPKESFKDKITVLLYIIGIYTFVFGILDQSGILKELEAISKDMTSENLYRFMRGNSNALALLFATVSMVFDPDKVNVPISYFIEPFISLLIGTISVLFTIFYTIMVLPLSYLAYVIVSIPISAILSASHDILFEINGSKISIQQIIAQNTVTIKNLLVAILSFFLSAIFKVPKAYLPNSIIQKIKHWFSNHYRVLNFSLICMQTFIVLLIIVSAIYISTIPIAFPSIEVQQKGELIGFVILDILLLTIFILLYLKIRRARKSIIKV